MVKLRQVKSSKKQIESKVKLENHQENVNNESFTHSGESNKKQCEEKELYENKIIKEFLTKRKLLMKALKQKQKSKMPKLLTFQAYQNKEGFSSNRQNSSISSNHSNGKSIQKQQKSNQNASRSQSQTQIHQTQKFGTRTNVAIQTKMLSKKKIIKKIFPRVNTSDKYIFDCLNQDQKVKDDDSKQNSFSSSIKKAKSIKDLEKIKNQIISHFNKNNGQQIRENKNKSDLNTQTFSESQTLSIYHKNISTAINKLNEEVQNYYETKSLRKIIMKQFKQKIKKRSTKSKKTIQMVRTVSNNYNKKSKSKSIKKSEKYEQLLFQIDDRENKIQQKKKQFDKQKTTRNTKNKLSTRKIINERFKRVLDSDYKIKIEKNNQRSKQEKNKLNKSQQKDQIFYDSGQNQTDFDAMEAWKGQFQSIQIMLLQKYDFLGKYLAQNKKVPYKQIYNGIRKRGKEVSDKLSSQKKSSTYSGLSLSNISSYIDLKRQRNSEFRNNSKKITSKLTSKKMKASKGKLFKQLKLDRNEQDQFGKSFDFHQEAEIANQQNFTLDDLNKSNVISHIFNSSFYSDSLHKKSDSNSDGKKKSLDHSFFSHQKNSLQATSNNHSDTNKSIKQNERSMSKCSEGKQIFYMSQQIVLDLKYNN